MSTATTVAVTVLVICLAVIAVMHRSRTVGPLVGVGVVLGLAVGVSATLLAAGLT